MRERLPVLLLTGRHQNKRNLVEVSGNPVWLPPGQFRAVCLLVAARFSPESPAVALPKATVWRLCNALAQAAKRAGIKDDLILRVAKNKFILELSTDQIAVDATFGNLPPTLRIAGEVAERLLAKAAAPETT